MEKSLLSSQKLIVMGGTRGIGRAVALTFADRGARVAVCGRDERSLEAIERELSEKGARYFVRRCDVGKAEEVESFVTAAASAIDGVDTLVNCASAFSRSDDESGWLASVSIDLMGTVRACHAAEAHLKRSENGSIINVASVAAIQATPARAPYGAAKAAVVHLSATLALKLASHRIRVNCVMPGSTDFEGGIWDRIRQEKPEFYEETKAKIPFGRFARPSDIVKVIRFLASDEASWITGQSLVVDGGQMLHGF